MRRERIAPRLHASLFHGPPGTGKTLTACLLGKRCGRDVYVVDLSLVVSKYIGETEKNLARVFDMRRERQAGSCSSTRPTRCSASAPAVSDAHDRYANQEVSYLLQRIEAFNGVVILASNLRRNIDDAFLRRFQSVVYFPTAQGPAERLRLWRERLPPRAALEPAHRPGAPGRAARALGRHHHERGALLVAQGARARSEP